MTLLDRQLELIGAVIKRAMIDYSNDGSTIKNKGMKKNVKIWHNDAKEFLFDKRKRRLENFLEKYGLISIINVGFLRKIAKTGEFFEFSGKEVDYLVDSEKIKRNMGQTGRKKKRMEKTPRLVH